MIVQDILNYLLQLGTVFLLATEGSLVVQRAGLLNLGIEGFFAMAAFVAYLVQVLTGNFVLSMLAAMAVAVVMNMMFTVLTVHLRLNHIVSGLAVAMFGVGLAYALGRGLVQIPVYVTLPTVNICGVYVDPVEISSFIIVGLLWYMIYRTKLGYKIRIVGEDPYVADMLGVDITKVRYIATFIEGALVGAAACYYILVSAGAWSEGVTIGKGWLAIVLAMMGLWDPVYALVAVYTIVTIRDFIRLVPGIGTNVYLLEAVSYLIAISILAAVSRYEIRKRKRVSIPLALAKVYSREERARKYT